MGHLLVTNDFPPKVGGIQSYLWELWRRLPPEDVTVLTIDHDGAAVFDAAAPFRIERLRVPMLMPTQALRRRIDKLAAEVGAGLVLLDPALPVGLLGPSLDRPYGLVLHGAELTVAARLPLLGGLTARVLRSARLLVGAGNYPLAEAGRAIGSDLPGARKGSGGPRSTLPDRVAVLPGVDVERFHPLGAKARAAARERFALPANALLVVGVSRLVPRKGFDVLIEAVAALSREFPRLSCAIAGTGRDRPRLEALARRVRAPVRFLGFVPDADLPALYGCCDVFAMLCRTRWLGLEQEGYGVVFNEAAAAGVVSLAGRSGGADEAVIDGVTGLVVERPGELRLVTEGLRRLLADEGLRRRFGEAARARAESELSIGAQARRLGDALAASGA